MRRFLAAAVLTGVVLAAGAAEAQSVGAAGPRFMLSGVVVVEGGGRAWLQEPTLTQNQYYSAEPLIADVAKALAVGRTPYTLTFFEQINDPSGPWLQALQRAYYTDDDLDQVISDAKAAMKKIADQG